LSPVMPGWTLPTPQLYAVFASRQGMVPAVRAFVDYLVETLDAIENASIECPTREQVQAAQALMPFGAPRSQVDNSSGAGDSPRREGSSRGARTATTGHKAEAV
jgi:hypothetical protein